MALRHLAFSAFAIICALPCFAQLSNQPQLKIDSSDRTLAVSAQEQVTAEPDVAILHIGFVTPLSDAQSAYAAGASASNQIVAAIKQAGIAESAIHSESQRLEPVDIKAHKFRLAQYWTVRVSPSRVAEILDIAVAAGATESGDIEWTIENRKLLEDKALEQAAARARSDAVVLARGMGVQLGKLLYTSNQGSAFLPTPRPYAMARMSAGVEANAPPLAIEPQKVTASATVYAVFAIE